jgi:hypothetical protein
MATYTPFQAGDYQRRQNQIEYQYSNDAATNAYGRFLGQQRGTRNLGDMSRTFQRAYPTQKAQFGRRGLAGAGINSGVQRQAMQNYVGDYARQYQRGQQDMTQEAQQYDLQQQQSDAFRQQSLMELEMEKARQIAEDAASLQALRSMYGGLG